MKKYSTQAYYNYAKRMLEGEAVVSDEGMDVDPDLKALYDAVDGLESKKPGSAERFVKVIQTKYGVTSANSLKKTLSDCLKVAVGGLSVSGFIIAMYKAIESGTALYRHIFSGNYVSSSYVTTEFSLITFPCLLVSFVFYKILKYIISSYNKTESVNTLISKKLNKVRKQKAILESQLFVDRLNDLLIESDTGKVSMLNVTAQKAYAICKKMFGWIKKKVAEGWGWIKKHPYITIAFLIIIGGVSYYIHTLHTQINQLGTAYTDLYSKYLDKLNQCLDVQRYSQIQQHLGETRDVMNNAINDMLNFERQNVAYDVLDKHREMVAGGILRLPVDKFMACIKNLEDVTYGAAASAEVKQEAGNLLFKIKNMFGTDNFNAMKGQLSNLIASAH